MKGRNITQTQVNQMNNLIHVKGMSVKAAAAAMGISPQCIYRYTKLDKNGNPPKPAGVISANRKKKANKKASSVSNNKSYSLCPRKEAYDYVCKFAESHDLSKVDAIDYQKS